MDVRMPDGTVITNVPEGTTQQELSRRLGLVNQPVTTQAAVSARSDLVPQPADSYSQKYNPQQSTFGYVANEVGKALTGIAGIPDAVMRQEADSGIGPAGILSRLGIGLRNAIGGPSMAGISRVLGVEPDMKAPGPATKFLTGAGIDIGQNLAFPGGGLVQKVASGLGSSVGRMMGEGSTAGEVAGGLLGGVAAPAFVATRVSALNSVKNLLSNPNGVVDLAKNNPQFMARIKTDVINELADSLRQSPDEYAAKFAAAQELEKSIPGLRLNLGQSFMAPSVLQKQRALEASSPYEMNTAQTRRNENEALLRNALGENKSAAGVATNAVSDLAGGMASQSRDLAAQIEQTSAQARSISSSIAQRADQAELGQKALDIRSSELGKARAKANSLMDLAKQAADSEGAQFDATPIVSKAKEIMGQPVWDDANVTSVFGKIRGLEGQASQTEWNPITGATVKPEQPAGVSFDDIRQMRAAVNADIASALRSSSPNARTQLRNLEQLKGTIDDAVESSPFSQTKQAYGDFIDFYKKEFAPRFLRGVNILAEKTTSTGEPRLPPEKVFQNYFKPNGATEMSRYLKLYGDNSEAMTAMRDAVLDRYAKEAIKDGVIDPAAHKVFLDRYRLPLSTLDRAGFKFGQDLQNNSAAYAAVSDRLAFLKDAAERSDKDLVRKLITDQFGTRTPEQITSDLMEDPRKMAILLGRMDKNQASGMVDFIRDDLVRQFSKNGQISPDAIDSFLSDRPKVTAFKAAISKVYSPEAADQHITTLRNISEAAKRLEATPTPESSAVAGKPSLFKDELQKKTGLSIAVVGNMVRAVIAGRVSPEWAALALGSQAGATVLQNMKNEIYRDILKDPESAQMLLRVMRTPPESAGGLAATARLLKKIPSLVGYYMGINRYGEFGKFAGANVGRSLSEQENR